MLSNAFALLAASSVLIASTASAGQVIPLTKRATLAFTEDGLVQMEQISQAVEYTIAKYNATMRNYKMNTGRTFPGAVNKHLISTTVLPAGGIEKRASVALTPQSGSARECSTCTHPSPSSTNNYSL